MQALYLASVFVHVVAAAVWLGGTCFIVLVMVPTLRARDPRTAASLLRESGTRFRNVAWICFALVAITGSYNLHVRGVRVHDFAVPSWRSSPFGVAVVAKLATFAIVFCASALHDFVLGPRASRAIESDPHSSRVARLRGLARTLGRATLLLALVLVGLGVVIVRGWPF